MMRSIWKGSLAFGLVNVPINVYRATEDHDIRFHQAHRGRRPDRVPAHLRGRWSTSGLRGCCSTAMRKPEQGEDAEVVDLLAALKRSVDRHKEAAQASAAKESAEKKGTASRTAAAKSKATGSDPKKPAAKRTRSRSA